MADYNSTHRGGSLYVSGSLTIPSKTPTRHFHTDGTALITMTDARLIRNGSLFTFTCFSGGTVVAVAKAGAAGLLGSASPGEMLQAWLSDNSTEGGTWITRTRTLATLGGFTSGTRPSGSIATLWTDDAAAVTPNCPSLFTDPNGPVPSSCSGYSVSGLSDSDIPFPNYCISNIPTFTDGYAGSGSTWIGQLRYSSMGLSESDNPVGNQETTDGSGYPIHVSHAVSTISICGAWTPQPPITGVYRDGYAVWTGSSSRTTGSTKYWNGLWLEDGVAWWLEIRAHDGGATSPGTNTPLIWRGSKESGATPAGVYTRDTSTTMESSQASVTVDRGPNYQDTAGWPGFTVDNDQCAYPYSALT